jgi:hypothetical protein
MPDQPTFEQPDWRPNTVINVAGDLNQSVPAAPSFAPPAIIPYPPNQVFVGRDAELRQLAEWLERLGAAVAIAGLGRRQDPAGRGVRPRLRHRHGALVRRRGLGVDDRPGRRWRARATR